MTSASASPALPWTRHPRADGIPVPIGDPEEEEGYGDDDDDEDEDDDDDEDDEEPWQVARAARDAIRLVRASTALHCRVPSTRISPGSHPDAAG